MNVLPLDVIKLQGERLSGIVENNPVNSASVKIRCVGCRVPGYEDKTQHPKN